MSSELDRALLARDVYRVWKRRVQQSTESVRVFTPYLDGMLDRLLGNATLDPDALAVVTNLSPDELQDSNSLGELMQAALATFTYSELGIGDHTPRSSFPAAGCASR